jgi:hypothetical protein
LAAAHTLPPEQRQQQDDGEGNPDKPKQSASSERHENLLVIAEKRNDEAVQMFPSNLMTEQGRVVEVLPIGPR